ncbi:MFS family permease [Marmoricola sp. URHA0025 HA25]
MTHTHDHHVERRDDTVVTDGTNEAYDKFGGGNAGAAFFGWLVALAVAVLLSGIIGAVAAAIGNAQDVTQSDAERDAGTIGVAAAIALVAVLVIGYYAGGYVAGRMSRFDGARQGFLVWILGLVITVVAVALGWVFGHQYNVFDRVDLPRIPIPHDQITTGGVVTAAAVLVGTLIAAVAGGTVGRHYHARVDRYAARSELVDET